MVQKIVIEQVNTTFFPNVTEPYRQVHLQVSVVNTFSFASLSTFSKGEILEVKSIFGFQYLVQIQSITLLFDLV